MLSIGKNCCNRNSQLVLIVTLVTTIYLICVLFPLCIGENRNYQLQVYEESDSSKYTKNITYIKPYHKIHQRADTLLSLGIMLYNCPFSKYNACLDCYLWLVFITEVHSWSIQNMPFCSPSAHRKQSVTVLSLD